MRRKASKNRVNYFDLIGLMIGKLKVLTLNLKRVNGVFTYNCLCECGSKCVVRRGCLQSQGTQSCGCLRRKPYLNIVEDPMMGCVFGELTVIGRSSISSNHKYPYECLCSCGNKTTSLKETLLEGGKKHCGCRTYENKVALGERLRSQFNSSQYIGQKFGRLTVIEYIGFVSYEDSTKKLQRFNCRCICGNTKNGVPLYSLQREGNTTSCGCARKLRWTNIVLDDSAQAVSRRERFLFFSLKFTEKILKRDQYLCRICQEKKALEVHHIKPWKQYPECRFDEANLVALCWECHLDCAHGGSFDAINIEWEIYLQNYVSQFLMCPLEEGVKTQEACLV